MTVSAKSSELSDRPKPSGAGHRRLDNAGATNVTSRTPDEKRPDYEKRISRALTAIVVLLSVHVVYLGRSLMMPIVIACVMALLLRPIVRWLTKWKLPQSVGAAVVLFLALGIVTVAAERLVTPASEWIDRTPIELRLRQIKQKLEPVQQSLAQLNAATESLNGLTATSSDGESETPVGEVAIRQPSLVSNVMSTTSEVLAQAAICLVLIYFLLALGDTFLNSVVQLMPRLHEKRETVQLVRNVEHGISSYLLTVTVINAGLGLVIGVAMWLIGLPNPALWGVMAMLLNYVPYAGAFAGSMAVLLVGLISFQTLGHALVAPLVYFALNTAEGNFITPAIVGRSMSLNPIMVFLSLAFWGWMWGIGGALLAVPLLAILKIACDQFESTRPLAVLVSASRTKAEAREATVS